MWRAIAGYLCDAFVAAVIGVGIWLALSACLGCTTAKQVGGEIGGTVADAIACPVGLFDCGHVYMCDTPADNELGLVEICINDDEDDGTEQIESAEAMYGECEPTPRHQGLCRHCCGADCGRGGNAFNGTWCP
jgi:hypothetical protein